MRSLSNSPPEVPPEKPLPPLKGLSKYPQGDAAARWWFIFTMLWFPIFTTLGMILAIKFFYPTFLTDWAPLTFGRIRPAHVNGVFFGFISSGLIGVMFYVIPRLTNAD